MKGNGKQRNGCKSYPYTFGLPTVELRHLGDWLLGLGLGAQAWLQRYRNYAPAYSRPPKTAVCNKATRRVTVLLY